jgi:hypothetical protein
MPRQPLTKSARVSAEQNRISQLTNEHSAYFKVILSHQITRRFNFNSMRSRAGVNISPEDSLSMFRAFGKFLDDSIKLTITEVETKYGRIPDVSDGTFDPDSGKDVQVQHMCLYPKGSTSRGVADGVRIHGYIRTNGGYFVVTRMDWFHDYHGR